MPKKKPKPHQITVIRYVDAEGRRCKAGDLGAVRSAEKSETYYGHIPSLTAGERPERISLGTSDLGAAWVELRDRLDRRARELEGIRDPLLAHARKPLTAHVEDWLAEVGSRGTAAEQVKLLRSRVLKLASLGEWSRLGDVTAESAAAALGRLQKERSRGMPKAQAGLPEYEGRSAQTRNHYLSALKQFCTWAADAGRLPRHPLRRLKPVSVETDRRHDRRSPTDKEVGQLMTYLEGPTAAVRCRMTGPQRALGYRLSQATGFRARELRSLRPESFDLARGTVTVRACYSRKAKRTVSKELPAWLVAEVKGWLAAGGGLWEGFPANWPGRLLNEDLAAAGVAQVVDGPEGPLFFDFHSLRHWYVSWVANRPGISPKTLMEMARHSDPRLTLKVYAKAQRDEVKGHTADLPRPGAIPAQPDRSEEEEWSVGAPD